MPPILIIHLVILAWSFTAVLGKLITLPAPDMVVWRAALSTLGFAALALAFRSPLRLPVKQTLSLLAVGGLLGVHWVLFFLSGRLATASVSLAALPTLMIWCSLIEPLINRTRRWSWIELFVGSLIVGAVWLIYSVEIKYWLGFTVGLVSAFFAAVYSVWNKQIVHHYSFTTLCTWQLAGACLAAWALLPWIGGHPLPEVPNTRDTWAIIVLAFGCTVLPYGAFVYVLRHLPIFTINVVYNLEPLYGIALAALVFGSREQMSLGFYAGAAIIIGSVLSVPWLQRRIGASIDSPSGRA